LNFFVHRIIDVDHGQWNYSPRRYDGCHETNKKVSLTPRQCKTRKCAGIFLCAFQHAQEKEKSSRLVFYAVWSDSWSE
jgi:hypothetical protein